jgi:hypothetical protein
MTGVGYLTAGSSRVTSPHSTISANASAVSTLVMEPISKTVSPSSRPPPSLGCSSGFGLDTAAYFLDRDWTVIVTMRNPRDDLLPPTDRLRILPLDVSDADSIAQAVEAAGPIDVLVNNAGVGHMGPLEVVSMAQMRELFETNTLGTIAMTQAVLPSCVSNAPAWSSM